MMEKPNQRTLQVSFYLVELKIVYVIVHEGTENEIDKKKKKKSKITKLLTYIKIYNNKSAKNPKGGKKERNPMEKATKLE